MKSIEYSGKAFTKRESKSYAVDFDKVNNFEDLKNIVQRIDPVSFFIITDCYQAFGGYRKEKYPFM